MDFAQKKSANIIRADSPPLNRNNSLLTNENKNSRPPTINTIPSPSVSRTQSIDTFPVDDLPHIPESKNISESKKVQEKSEKMPEEIVQEDEQKWTNQLAKEEREKEEREKRLEEEIKNREMESKIQEEEFKKRVERDKKLQEIRIVEDNRLIKFVLDGGYLIKHSTKGKSQRKYVYCADVVGEGPCIIWRVDTKRNISKDSHIRFSEIDEIIEGCKTDIFKKSKSASESRSFSLKGKERTLDFEAYSEEDKSQWTKALRLAILLRQSLKIIT